MAGVIRHARGLYYFESEGGWTYPMLVSRRFLRRPYGLDERLMLEALYTPDGSLMVYRIFPLGYDLTPPMLIGWRMLWGSVVSGH